MKKKTWKKLAAVSTAAAMTLSLAACGNSQGSGKESGEQEMDVTINQIKLGEDYTDLKADLKFLTNRTDFVDTVFQDYIKEFQKMYPDINIEYEGLTNYGDVTTRLVTGDWGDICMIESIDKDELGNYFTKLGDREGLGKIYDDRFLDNSSYEGNCYGLPCAIDVKGIVYNKAVFDKAGVKELPKTPDEFIEALKKIKENTDAIPLYTNFGAGNWTMSEWDSSIAGGATGDPDFQQEGYYKGENPFSDRGDGTGPYAVYNTLYEAVKQGLTEDDPTTTDWEGSKGMLNRGEIGCMVLGSWALVQIQDAGENGDDIGYMTFPITVDGKQYIPNGGGYCYGINCNSSRDNQIAAMCYVKYLVEESGFSQGECALSIVLDAEIPEALSNMEGELIVNTPAAEGEENLGTDIENDSELKNGAIPIQVVEEATSGTKTMDEMADEWNEKWTSAQEANGITH